MRWSAVIVATVLSSRTPVSSVLCIHAMTLFVAARVALEILGLLMRVLVAGATGFVGQHVVPQLIDRGHEITIVARDEEKARGFAWFKRVRFVRSDINNLSADPVATFGAQDAVVYLAWSGLPNYSLPFHFEENLPASYHFIKQWVQAGVDHVLVTGTCFEYGMRNGCLAESMPTDPRNPYALAKDTLRKFLESLREQSPYTLQWARLFYMYGPGQNAKSVLAQLDHAIDAGESVFNMSGGEQLRDYLPVTEVASRLATLVEHPDWDGIINICCGSPISVRRLVERHVAARGAKINLNLGYYAYPTYEPMAFWGDGRRFATLVVSR